MNRASDEQPNITTGTDGSTHPSSLIPHPSDFPPAPWHLQGDLFGSIWAVPRRMVRVELPSELELVVNFGRVGVFAGFVDYQPGSTLTYHELIAGAVVKECGRLNYAFHVTHIWVDSVASLWGGRELWGVPKELARLDFEQPNRKSFGGVARLENGQVLAEGDFTTTVGMPDKLRLPVPFPNLQSLHGALYQANGTYKSSSAFCRGGMKIPANSPLAALGIGGRQPLLSFAGRHFTMLLRAARPLRP